MGSFLFEFMTKQFLKLDDFLKRNNALFRYNEKFQGRYGKYENISEQPQKTKF